MRTIVSSELCTAPDLVQSGHWGKRSHAAFGLLLALGTLAAGCGGSPYAADTGFRPAQDGFSFANYGSEAGSTDLDAARMVELFGDKVCASKAGGKCILTPPGERWRKQINHQFGFGHCEGMAALSALLFTKSSGLAPSQFGAATTSELQLKGNLTLETEIAKWGSTQVLTPTRLGEFGAQNTPKEVIEKLRQMWSAGEYPTLRVKRLDIVDGHSFFPYQIIDKGGGTIALMVYDPDYPKQERELTLDLNTNQWSYLFSVSAQGVPYKYEGGATTNNLRIVSTSGRLGKQDCSFCKGGAGSNSPFDTFPILSVNAYPKLEVSSGKTLEAAMSAKPALFCLPNGRGDYSLECTAAGANAIFIVNPRLLNGPGPTPLINLPSADDFFIKLKDIDATKDTPTSLTLTGPGYELVVGDILLHPGQEDTILLPKGQGQITYSTTADETPIVTVGFESPDADFELSIIADGNATGLSVTVKKDEIKGEFSFQIKNAANYTLQMIRIDAQGEQVFSHDGETITSDDTVIVNYGAWQGQGTPLTLQIDHASDGTIDQTVQISDEDLPQK